MPIGTDCWNQAAQHLALTTFVFPDSSSRSASSAPAPDDIPIPANASAQPVPHTPNLFGPFSHDSSLAFTVPFDQVPQFLKAVQEIPDTSTDDDEAEQKKWIMVAARGATGGSRRALWLWMTDAWSSFVDLIKVFEFPMRGCQVTDSSVSTSKPLTSSS